MARRKIIAIVGEGAILNIGCIITTVFLGRVYMSVQVLGWPVQKSSTTVAGLLW